MAEFVRVASVAEIPPGTARCVLVNHQRIAIYNVNGDFYATDDICSHAEASLSEGELDGYEIECPLHGARFDVRSGAALCLPAVAPVETFAVKVEDGAVLVKV